MGEIEIKVGYFYCKKASLLGTNVVEVKRDLKVFDIVKTYKCIKVESELVFASIGNVGEINPWIQKKRNEVVDLVYVVGNELEVVRLKVDNINKVKECLCNKMEHVKVVHKSMTSMKEKKEKKLQALLLLGETNGGNFGLQLVTLDFYRQMECKQDETIIGFLVQ
jgi:hypothetical protein